MKKTLILILAPLLFSFHIHADDDDKPPAWTKNSTRSVDNGYIVYVSSGEDRTPEKARLKAEGQAIQDLANECSFAPKGARVEDSYSEVIKDLNRVFVKLAVEYSSCDEAKKTTEPQDIKNMASLPMTEELKRYQDLVDQPEEVATLQPSSSPVAQAASSNTTTNTNTVVVIHDEPMFFFWRQQVAYEKEVVIVAPAGAYAPGTPGYTTFVRRVGPMTQQITTYERENPQVVKQNHTWSNVPNRPAITKPHALAASSHPMNTPHTNPAQNHPQKTHSSEHFGGEGRHRGGHHHRF